MFYMYEVSNSHLNTGECISLINDRVQYTDKRIE